MAKGRKQAPSDRSDNQGFTPSTGASRNAATKRLSEKLDRIGKRDEQAEKLRKEKAKWIIGTKDPVADRAHNNVFLSPLTSSPSEEKSIIEWGDMEDPHGLRFKPLSKEDKEELQKEIKRAVRFASPQTKKEREEVQQKTREFLVRADKGKYPVLRHFEFPVDKTNKNTGNKTTRTRSKSSQQGTAQLPVENEILQSCVIKLQDKFGVTPQIVQTDAEFYSDSVHRQTVQNKVYFLSKENPEESFKVTSAIIRQSEIRYEMMHANRLEKTKSNALNHLNFIEEIKAEYRASHENEDPSNYFIAQVLNERKVATPRGGDGKWQSKTVQRVIDRTQSKGSIDHR